MRVRTKDCSRCAEAKEVLYRCRYNEQKGWSFLCEPCLMIMKREHETTFQYGGTWKAKKR